MTPDREYELLARIEQLKDEVQSVTAYHTEALIEVQKLREQLKQAHNHIRAVARERDVAEDRLRAAQSQGAV